MHEYRQAHIDLDALQANYLLVKSLVPHSKLMAMVKSNAYGHGLVKIAHALPLADAFGVATINEAIALRTAGIRQPIILLAGFFEPAALSLISHHNLEIVVHQEEQVRVLEKVSLQQQVKVWLKIDTGMHRLGFAIEHAKTIYQRLRQCSSVAQPIVVMSHFASADDVSKTTTQEQLKAFNQALQGISAPKSMAHSAGILSCPESHFDWVRPGMLLYGVSPMLGDKENASVPSLGDGGLQPVMTLQARLIAINALHKGDSVGYGGTWTCDEDMRVGVVSIGYGDGYPRHAVSGTPVLINGCLCSLVGRVSMDFLTVDLRQCPQAKIGDTVTLWGRGLPITHVAEQAGSIPYELTCQVTSRVEFIYQGESKAIEQEELLCV